MADRPVLFRTGKKRCPHRDSNARLTSTVKTEAFYRLSYGELFFCFSNSNIFEFPFSRAHVREKPFRVGESSSQNSCQMSTQPLLFRPAFHGHFPNDRQSVWEKSQFYLRLYKPFEDVFNIGFNRDWERLAVAYRTLSSMNRRLAYATVPESAGLLVPSDQDYIDDAMRTREHHVENMELYFEEIHELRLRLYYAYFREIMFIPENTRIFLDSVFDKTTLRDRMHFQ